MKNEKMMIRFFTVPQWEQEQDFLSRQHRNGWKFTKLDFLCCYHFEKCEPEDVVYQLDYNPDGMAHKAEYVQLFHDCGWEYLQDYVGYSYFRKSVSQMDGDEEIFCDAASRLDFMKRVFRGRMLTLLVVVFGICMPQLTLQSLLHNRGLVWIYVVLVTFCLVIFLWFVFQYLKCLKQLR